MSTDTMTDDAQSPSLESEPIDSPTSAPPQENPPPTPPSSHDGKDTRTEEAQSRSQKFRCPIHGNDARCREVGLGLEQREEITAKLLEPTEISFNKSSEALRNNTQGASNMLPTFFYRTFYETSVTLSSRVSKDTHVKHRERQHLKIKKGNAFQAVGKVVLRRDLTKPRIERQLIWNKKRNPSSYISVFNTLDHAKRRANFHYANSQRIGHRVSIAEISTSGLIAATLSAICERTWKVYTKVPLGESVKFTVTCCPVDIPIWISAHARPADGSSITLDKFESIDAELWMSITELRGSNLKDQPHGHDRRRMILANGHSYEWLALGRVPESRITRVMPWDGEELHEHPSAQTIFSKSSAEPWIYDQSLQSWRLDPTLFAQAKYPNSYPSTSNLSKRKRIYDSDDTDNEQKIHSSQREVLDMSTITTIAYGYI